MGIEQAVAKATAAQFEAWVAAHHASERELWAAIYKKASKKQTVGFEPLLEIAFCWGWVDVQNKSIVQERYGIRFVPRRPGSNWSVKNRGIVCWLFAENRLQPSGAALLPPDFICP